MNDYNDLVKRLNKYSATYQNHGGITAEASDAIKELMIKLQFYKDFVGCMTDQNPNGRN